MLVVVTVVDGVLVTLKVNVGVCVIVTGGPALMANERIQAKVNPSITIVQVPEYIWLL